MRGLGAFVIAAVVVVGCGGSDSTNEPPKTVAVPNVVGMPLQRAKTVLAARGLKGREGWVDPYVRANLNTEPRPCVGIPGDGPVSDQSVTHGVGPVNAGAVISLRTGCPTGSSLPRCPDGELQLHVSPLGGTGLEWVSVRLDHVAGPPCRIDGDLSLSIEKSGRPLPVFRNNPATVHLSSSMGVGEELTATWDRPGCLRINYVTYVARVQAVVGSTHGQVGCAANQQTQPALSADAKLSFRTYRWKYNHALSGIRR
jgi:hypothetical protein